MHWTIDMVSSPSGEFIAVLPVATTTFTTFGKVISRTRPAPTDLDLQFCLPSEAEKCDL